MWKRTQILAILRVTISKAADNSELSFIKISDSSARGQVSVSAFEDKTSLGKNYIMKNKSVTRVY